MSFLHDRPGRLFSGSLLIAVSLLASGCNKKNKATAPSAKTSTPPTSSQTASVVVGTAVTGSYLGALADAVDVSAAVSCGSGTDGLGACTSDSVYLIVCSGGKGYAFDCTQVAPGASCITDADSNQLGCGSPQ